MQATIAFIDRHYTQICNIIMHFLAAQPGVVRGFRLRTYSSNVCIYLHAEAAYQAIVIHEVNLSVK